VHVLAILLVGAVTVAGAIWQRHLWRADKRAWNCGESPRRFRIALCLSAIIVAGTIVVSAFMLAEGRLAVSEFFVWVFKAVVFCAAINAKTLFGPTFVALTTAAEIYFWFEYHEFRAIPVLSNVADWVFECAPDWLGAAYLVAQTLFCLLSAGFDSVEAYCDY
jgi:hypothetical protein